MVRFLVRAVLSKETDHLVASDHWLRCSCGRQGEQHRPDRGKKRESAANDRKVYFHRAFHGSVDFSAVPSRRNSLLMGSLPGEPRRRSLAPVESPHLQDVSDRASALPGTHPRHRSVELIKSVFHDSRHDLGRDASGFPAFIDDHCAMRSSHCIDDCLAVQRPQRT